MTTREEKDRRYAGQIEVFERLYERAETLMQRFGRPNHLPGQPYGDYTVHGDYGGCPEVVVFATSLEMFRPPVVGALQHLIKEFPGWEIELVVALRDHLKDWPKMGLYIRPHEIIDGLQREYFPKKFQDIDYAGLEGARLGTAYD